MYDIDIKVTFKVINNFQGHSEDHEEKLKVILQSTPLRNCRAAF